MPQDIPAGMTETPIGGDVPKGMVETPISSPAKQPSQTLNPDNYSGVQGVAAGVAKAATKTLEGVGNLAGDVIGKKDAGNEMFNSRLGSPDLESKNMSQGVGEFLENSAEWLGGEEAAKGLSELGSAAKFLKTPEAWHSYLTAHPTLSGSIDALGRILRYGAVGGVQGGVKGAATDQPIEGAEAGIKGAIEGGATGELLHGTVLSNPVINYIAKKVGVNRVPVEEFIKAARPGKWDSDFGNDFKASLPYLAPEVQAKPLENMTDLADRAQTAKEKLWHGPIQDAIKPHVNNFVGTTKISDELANMATDPALLRHSQGGSQDFLEAAQKWSDIGGLSIGDLEKDLEHLNAKLTTAKWWSKTDAERSAALRVGDKNAIIDQEARLLRETLYDHLEDTAKDDADAANNIRNLKQAYGSLANIERTVRGRANIVDRQVPMSLKEIIGLSAAATAGPKGWIAAAIPYLDEYVNNPTRMAQRAIENASNPEQSVGSKVVKKIKKGSAALPKTGAAIGASSEEE